MAQNTYATVDQLKQVVDVRILEQLSTDNPSSLGDVDDVQDQADFLIPALKRASADVESHCLKGRIYTVEDLEALEADEDWTLIQLVCFRAMAHLFSRRGGQIPSVIQDGVNQTNETLKALGEGKRIFRKESAAEAGLGTVVVTDSFTRAKLNMASDQAIFPTRRTHIA